jgi:2-oxo-4-hydroxy-4-carboxy-5-ureidoimidazoline decarboxylase
VAEPHEVLNDLSEAEAATALGRCCGASAWVSAMVRGRPYASREALLAAAERVWAGMGPADLLEAFAHHPRIGASVEELRARFAGTSAWASQEQGGVKEAPAEVLEALRAANVAYEQRFGFIFIVCASGKSAEEMLALLQARLLHEPARELPIAAAEQAKITRLRLEKLAASRPGVGP